ncbi:MAG: serine/threonine protein kinase, partial [Candidatus Eremiobacteraeota bacterium]|nr:serine/threonine protein kinase [Candidatus Eremiobacteraeota bacterium]
PQYSDDAEYVARFQRETSITSKLDHRHIVHLLDYGEDEQLGCFQVFEYVEGETLRSFLERGKPPIPDALRLTRELLDGLAYAHHNGIVHRDIKPENLLLDADGQLIISDFGVALATQGTTLTRTGFMPGTPDYMSPEQLSDKAVGPPSDLYAVGVVLYEMLTGQTPFAADNVAEVIQRQVYQLPHPPSYRNLEIGPELDAFVLKALEKRPEDRFGSAAAMSAALAAVRTPTVPAPKSEPGKNVETPRPVEPTVMVQASELPTSTPVSLWLLPLACLVLACFLGVQTLHLMDRQPVWAATASGAAPAPVEHRLFWALRMHGAEVALLDNSAAMSGRDRALAGADILAAYPARADQLKCVQDGDSWWLEAGERKLLEVAPEQALELSRPPEAIARYWQALLADHLELRAGREPHYTRVHEREYPLRPDEKTPVSPLFAEVYQRARNLERSGPLDSRAILAAIESLPSDHREHFRQAARSIPIKIPEKKS